jgi:hypothetical protein
MTDVPFPMLTAPGQTPWLAGGRLVNCYPEPLPATAGKPYAYRRVPGVSYWAFGSSGIYRGGVLVGGTFYAVIGNSVYALDGTGNGAALTGAIPGSGMVACAVDQNATPNVVFVVPGTGAFWINGSNVVVSYPDVNVGTPNWVVYIQGYFIFSYGSGLTQASNINSTTINTLNYAYANTKADALYRPVPLGYGQLLLCGANTMEVWGGQNDTGYPFSYQSTIYRGIPGPNAIAGQEDGWGKGLFFVGDDNRVSTLTGTTPTPISVLDLDQAIEATTDKTTITVGVFVSRGHGFVIVQSPTWCWIYDTTLQSWHERRSYLQTYWRGYKPIYLNFGTNPFWACGDVRSASILKIDGSLNAEGGLNDTQTISISGTPTAGSFVLSFNGQLSAAISYNATAAQVQTALNNSVLLNGNINCGGGPLPASPVSVNFFNRLGLSPQPVMLVATNSLNAGVPVVTHTTTGAIPDPLRIRVETGPLGAFPKAIRINEIEVYMTKGTSNALGHDPDETNAQIGISMSRDGGQTWSNSRNVPIGRQSVSSGRARSAIWGQADIQGVRWRFEESAGLNFAFMGADMLSDTLR